MEQLRQVPGAVDVGLSEQDPQAELKIELDRGLANSMGITVADAAQALRVAFAGIEVGDWVDPAGETRDVAVRLHPEDRLDASQHRTPAHCRDGHQPHGAAGADRHRDHGQGPQPDPARRRQAHHQRGRQCPGPLTGRGDARRLKLARAMDFPPGYGLELAGASRDQQEVFKEMGIALVMGVALMYLILVMQFGSFTAPLGVMLSLPLSLIGVVLALLLTGGTLNLMSFIGVIMLMGLVAKNAILLLDAARAQEALGMELKKYPNRRLYDTRTSSYITLADVKQMVLAARTSRCATPRRRGPDAQHPAADHPGRRIRRRADVQHQTLARSSASTATPCRA
jgi:HAE1 family hydrophobic/amphiphilic exporter-1